MHAFKIDIMALLVVAVVIGVGLTMALSHNAGAGQDSVTPDNSSHYQTHISANPVQSQFIKAAQPEQVSKLPERVSKEESRI